jgi:hypothetical protein
VKPSCGRLHADEAAEGSPQKGLAVSGKGIRRKSYLALKSLELVYRRVSAVGRTLPNVFILGAIKSGSTSLTLNLWSHPAHVPAFAKELMYLQQLPGFTSAWEFHPIPAFLCGRYENGHAKYCLGGYKKFFPLKVVMAGRAARHGGRAITSDCDPNNLYCSVATQRIKSFAQDPRFIVSLRNPIDRAYSDYNMGFTRDRTERRSFEECIEDELAGRYKSFHKRYLYQSIYAPHLRRWIDAFGRDRFLIINAEQYFSSPAKVVSDMFRFLRLADVPVPLSVGNVGKYTTEMKPETRQRLKEYFTPFNEDLRDLLGWAHNLDADWNESRPELKTTWSKFQQAR